MIDIQANDETYAVKAEGHAGYGPKGQDIVCAGVSTLIYAYALELMKLGAEPDILDEGERFEVIPGHIDTRIKVAFDTVIHGLGMLADSYRNHIRMEGVR